MRALWYEGLGPAREVLRVGEIDDPQPQPGEVRVRIAASGVNPIDVKTRLGGRGDMTSLRIVPHFDGAGRMDPAHRGCGPALPPRPEPQAPGCCSPTALDHSIGVQGRAPATAPRDSVGCC